MKQVFDEDSANDISNEAQLYQVWESKEKNYILSINNYKKKQEAWNRLFPKLELEGLSEEELNQPY